MWFAQLKHWLENQRCAMVTIASIAGSAPRALGTHMLVNPRDTHGSIGGGNLEYEAIAECRRLLQSTAGDSARTALYGLGPELNQCCGGAVTLLYEVFQPGPRTWLEPPFPGRLLTAIDRSAPARWRLDAPAAHETPLPAGLASLLDAPTPEAASVLIEHADERFLLETLEGGELPVYLFGAGHVGRAVAATLAPLPFRITWIDSRPDMFPRPAIPGVQALVSERPAGEVGRAPPGSIYLVMTHSHALDEDICHQALQRDDAAWIGVIGSATKRRRFVHRLAQRGIAAGRLQELVCPIGDAGIRGKRPATIALAVATQLMQDLVPEAWR